MSTVLSLFRERVADAPDAPALHYFGRDIERHELDRLSDMVARGLARLGVVRGDRVALSLQNTPAYPICLLAAWKLGAVVVPVNPMLRAKELAHVLGDCEPRVLVAHPDLEPVVSAVAADGVRTPELVWSDPADLAGDLPGPWATDTTPHTVSGITFEELLRRDLVDPLRGSPGSWAGWRDPARADVALLTYTSGTTGPAKGSISTHTNLVYQAIVAAGWFGLTRKDRILTTAPFFHITGLGLHLAIALADGIPMVLTHRFDPDTVLELIERYRPTFTIGAITAFIALADRAEPGAQAMKEMHTCFSGGAPVPLKVVERYERDFGVYIHNIYGLTESTSACIAVPRGERAPVDKTSGALAIGVPLPSTEVTVVGDDGDEVPRGTPGELVVRGPSVGTGYWNRPEDTAHTFREDGLHTGDVAVIDDDGWVFIVDRKKDLLVVSGYKVWPREVEDVLYLHPAVREAAVVGRPDDYQGESVQAFVTLRNGQDVTAEDLQEHCRTHLSAYKCPREVVFLDDLPKTATGKILRRELRAW